MAGFNFAPVGYNLCNGQLLSIAQNTALFSLLGTNYGGDGVSTFGLPDLRGRLPIHQGQGPGLSSYIVGQVGGQEAVTLITSELPAHTHGLQAVSSAGTTNLPSGAYLAPGPSTGSGPNATSLNTYTATTTPLVSLNAASIQAAGGGQPHNNIQPYLCVTYIIAMQGVFPSRN